MADDAPKAPSFTTARRWRIGFDLTLRTVLAVAVMVMINYLGAKYFVRLYLSSQTQVRLASRTTAVLDALTNQVTVTLYYDKTDQIYTTILALLNEYQHQNAKLTVRTVDYVRDAGEAEKVQEHYHLGSAKDLVIFDLGGRTQIVPGDVLAQKSIEQVPDGKPLDFERKIVAFGGELWFTTALLALENPQPLKAYFLQGHGEPDLADTADQRGYLKFGRALEQNYLTVENLDIQGGQPVPDDCNLLIIAAPTEALKLVELQRIQEYLTQGGRLFALLDWNSIEHPTGLEMVLHQWGIDVGPDYVQDLKNSMSAHQDVIVRRFSDHPIAAPLRQVSLHLILPRPVFKASLANPPANAPDVEEIAFSGPESTLVPDSSRPPQSYPLVAVAEQKSAPGVANPRGNTRIVVVGDSYFLGNYYIEDNRDFVNLSVNWLLDRTALVSGVAPKKMTEFRLLMTRAQQQEIRWILLAGLPGAILLFGGCVWLVRRK